MKKIKKLIIGGILSLILTLSCVFIPKADINSVGSSLLNDNNIVYAFTLDESSPSASTTELTSGVGLYLNYIDYLNFYGYARQLTYNSNNYYLFDYIIYDSSLNEWQITGVINRTQNSQNDYDYSLDFVYDLPTLGQGNETLIDTNGINSNSNLYGLINDFVSANNVVVQNVNIFKLVATRLFSTNQGYTYTVDVEFTPTNTSSLGTDNNILKNFVSSQPFTQKTPTNSNIVYTNEWEPMTWIGFTPTYASGIWNNGTNYYYSFGNNQYRLNGTTWEPMTWSGLTPNNAAYVWTDGTNYYYSFSNIQYRLNGTTWEPMTWSGLTSFSGTNVWTDGTNYHYSSNDEQYKLNGTTWEPMTWNGLTLFYGTNVWTDGTNYYYSSGNKQYKLNGTTWEPMTWSGLTSFNGYELWTDGTNYYYSSGNKQYKLNGTTWEPMTWSGLTSFSGDYIWNNGNNIYYSNSSNQYKLIYEEIPQNPTYDVSYNLFGCSADLSNPTELDPDDENYIFRFNADRNNTLINATVNVEGAEILNIIREERSVVVVIYNIQSDVLIEVTAERTPYEVNVIYKINNNVVLTDVLEFKNEQFNIILNAKLNNLTELRTDNIYSGTLELTQPNNQIFTINNYYGYSDIIYSFFGQKVSLISVQTPSGGLSRSFNETEENRYFNLREFAEEQGVLNWLTITDNDQTIEINIMSNGNIETEQDQIIGITTNIFDGFSKLLNMTIGFISIGQILSIILVFSLLAFIIRMWKGGSGNNG